LVSCRIRNWDGDKDMYPESWCGQHPDFAAPEPVAEPEHKPSCQNCRFCMIDGADKSYCDRLGVEIDTQHVKHGLVCDMHEPEAD
jgi:hypothetical protein